MQIRIPILTYHSFHAGSPRDIQLFAQNLELIHAMGYTVIPLRKIVNMMLRKESVDKKIIGLSCDDGKRYDYETEPTTGHSMYSVLRAFRRRHWWKQRLAHLSCFVIGDQRARTQISLGDDLLMSDRWWCQARNTGLLGIENHSSDHAHCRVTPREGDPPYVNDFATINTYSAAHWQIANASHTISRLAGNNRCRLFAYPFGHWNDYLVNDYLPQNMPCHHLIAAFTTEPEPLTVQSSRWLIPRYVAQQHFSSNDDLACILRECGLRST